MISISRDSVDSLVKKQLIVFDWDDVFTIGSTKGYYACYHAALVDVGISLSADEEKRRIASKWGSPHTQEIEALLVEHPHLVNQAVKAYEKALFGDVFVSELSLVDGAYELIESLELNGYKLAISSGVHPKLLTESIMPKFGIDSSKFDQILTAYDLNDPKKSKPDPYTINKIMSDLHVSAFQTLMVGDAENDIKMAKSAGVESVAVLTGHMSRDDAVRVKAEFIIDDVTKLKELLIG